MTRTAAIYARISHDAAGTEVGVTRQLEECRQLAERLGLPITGEYVDNSVSAFSGRRRPQFEEMVKGTREGFHSVLITWATDRLYRRPADLENVLLPLFDQMPGLEVRTVTSGDIDLGTPEGRAMARIVGAMASQESERKAARVSAAARHRATREMRTPAARLPLGYAWAEPDPQDPARPRPGTRSGLVIDPVTGPAVRQAFEDLDKGMSLNATWRRMRETLGDRAPTRAGGLGKALRAPRYAGFASYRGEITGPASDGLPLVPEDMYRRVNLILTDPKRRTSPVRTGRGSKALLGDGLLLCHKCGGHMAASNKWSRSGSGSVKAAVYICSGHQHVTRRRERLDQAVTELVATVLSAMGEAGLLQAPDPTDSPEVAQARQTLAALEVREAEAAEAYAAGNLSVTLLSAASERIDAERAVAERVIAGATRRPALDALDALGAGAGAEFLRLVDSEPVRARGIMRQLFADLRTTDDNRRLAVRWNLPGDLPEFIRVGGDKPGR